MDHTYRKNSVWYREGESAHFKEPKINRHWGDEKSAYCPSSIPNMKEWWKYICFKLISPCFAAFISQVNMVLFLRKKSNKSSFIKFYFYFLVIKPEKDIKNGARFKRLMAGYFISQ